MRVQHPSLVFLAVDKISGLPHGFCKKWPSEKILNTRAMIPNGVKGDCLHEDCHAKENNDGDEK
jgi:hypothetical protein